MIGLILVTYAHYPQKLIDSVERSGRNVRWYVHHHGHDPIFASRIAKLSIRSNFRVHLHGVNRGLSKSWNEGLNHAYADGCDHAFLANDDLFFLDEGFARFTDFVATSNDYGVAFLQGLETGGSPYAGQVIFQGFACCSISKSTVNTVGYFDENIKPAYYEDFDYNRRCMLAGVKFITSEGVLVEHERSKTTRENAEIQANNINVMEINRAYYTRKWGKPEAEYLKVPFDDQRFGLKIEWENRSTPYPGYDAAS